APPREPGPQRHRRPAGPVRRAATGGGEPDALVPPPARRGPARGQCRTARRALPHGPQGCAPRPARLYPTVRRALPRGPSACPRARLRCATCRGPLRESRSVLAPPAQQDHPDATRSRACSQGSHSRLNYMSDPDFVVVANRLPVDLDRAADGSQRWTQSPGGLVAALEPFLRSRKGAWVGWPGVPDIEVDEFTDEGLVLHPVSLSSAEVRDYYEGFSNATLWPLYHDVVQPPVFERRWWDAYVRVNQRFAEASAKVAAQ